MLKKIFSNLIRVNENINRIVKKITKLMQKELRFELSRELKILRKVYLLIGKYDTNKNNKNCNQCKAEYTKKNNKIRHHDHISGLFIDSICYDCNIQLQYKKFIPVYI